MKLFFLLLTLSFFVDPAPTFQILPFGRLGGSGGEKPHLALPPPWIDTLPSYDVATVRVRYRKFKLRFGHLPDQPDYLSKSAIHIQDLPFDLNRYNTSDGKAHARLGFSPISTDKQAWRYFYGQPDIPVWKPFIGVFEDIFDHVDANLHPWDQPVVGSIYRGRTDWRPGMDLAAPMFMKESNGERIGYYRPPYHVRLGSLLYKEGPVSENFIPWVNHIKGSIDNPNWSWNVTKFKPPTSNEWATPAPYGNDIHGKFGWIKTGTGSATKLLLGHWVQSFLPPYDANEAHYNYSKPEVIVKEPEPRPKLLYLLPELNQGRIIVDFHDLMKKGGFPFPLMHEVQVFASPYGNALYANITIVPSPDYVPAREGVKSPWDAVMIYYPIDGGKRTEARLGIRSNPEYASEVPYDLDQTKQFDKPLSYWIPSRTNLTLIANSGRWQTNTLRDEDILLPNSPTVRRARAQMQKHQKRGIPSTSPAEPLSFLETQWSVCKITDTLDPFAFELYFGATPLHHTAHTSEWTQDGRIYPLCSNTTIELEFVEDDDCIYAQRYHGAMPTKTMISTVTYTTATYAPRFNHYGMTEKAEFKAVATKISGSDIHIPTSIFTGAPAPTFESKLVYKVFDDVRKAVPHIPSFAKGLLPLPGDEGKVNAIAKPQIKTRIPAVGYQAKGTLTPSKEFLDEEMGEGDFEVIYLSNKDTTTRLEKSSEKEGTEPSVRIPEKTSVEKAVVPVAPAAETTPAVSIPTIVFVEPVIVQEAVTITVGAPVPSADLTEITPVQVEEARKLPAVTPVPFTEVEDIPAPKEDEALPIDFFKYSFGDDALDIHPDIIYETAYNADLKDQMVPSVEEEVSINPFDYYSDMTGYGFAYDAAFAPVEKISSAQKTKKKKKKENAKSKELGAHAAPYGYDYETYAYGFDAYDTVDLPPVIEASQKKKKKKKKTEKKKQAQGYENDYGVEYVDTEYPYCGAMDPFSPMPEVQGSDHRFGNYDDYAIDQNEGSSYGFGAIDPFSPMEDSLPRKKPKKYKSKTPTYDFDYSYDYGYDSYDVDVGLGFSTYDVTDPFAPMEKVVKKKEDSPFYDYNMEYGSLAFAPLAPVTTRKPDYSAYYVGAMDPWAPPKHVRRDVVEEGQGPCSPGPKQPDFPEEIKAPAITPSLECTEVDGAVAPAKWTSAIPEVTIPHKVETMMVAVFKDLIHTDKRKGGATATTTVEGRLDELEEWIYRALYPPTPAQTTTSVSNVRAMGTEIVETGTVMEESWDLRSLQPTDPGVLTTSTMTIWVEAVDFIPKWRTSDVYWTETEVAQGGERTIVVKGELSFSNPSEKDGTRDTAVGSTASVPAKPNIVASLEAASTSPTASMVISNLASAPKLAPKAASPILTQPPRITPPIISSPLPPSTTSNIPSKSTDTPSSTTTPIMLHYHLRRAPPHSDHLQSPSTCRQHRDLSSVISRKPSPEPTAETWWTQKMKKLALPGPAIDPGVEFFPWKREGVKPVPRKPVDQSKGSAVRSGDVEDVDEVDNSEDVEDVGAEDVDVGEMEEPVGVLDLLHEPEVVAREALYNHKEKSTDMSSLLRDLDYADIYADWVFTPE